MRRSSELGHAIAIGAVASHTGLGVIRTINMVDLYFEIVNINEI